MVSCPVLSDQKKIPHSTLFYICQPNLWGFGWPLGSSNTSWFCCKTWEMQQEEFLNSLPHEANLSPYLKLSPTCEENDSWRLGMEAKFSQLYRPNNCQHSKLHVWEHTVKQARLHWIRGSCVHVFLPSLLTFHSPSPKTHIGQWHTVEAKYKVFNFLNKRRVIQCYLRLK